MKAKILFALCSAVCFCVEVHADGEQELRRGLYPFMAFIYYPDETVVDGAGERFLRGAVLIRPEWLVTSAVGSSIISDDYNGFPQKTLIARLGAVTIDANFTLNEDEDEQEREVIEIVRPYNHSATQWWRTDISLMKTLLPFNLTSAVGHATLNLKHEYVEKTCIILVYAKKYGNWSENRNLMEITVEVLPPSIENCGSNYIADTMMCATDSDENKNTIYDPNFCHGNSGGPLICENEVVGIQTYIDNNCKPPHLYQLLSAWENFISCGTEDKCHEEQCSNICDVSNKDPPPVITSSSEPHLMHTISSTSTTQEKTIEDNEISTGSPTPTVLSVSEESSSEITTVSETESTNPGVVSEAEVSVTIEKYSENRKKLEQAEVENPDRKLSVEAQQQDIKIKAKSSDRSNVSNTLTTFFSFFILACLI